jgi:hypothetical protein
VHDRGELDEVKRKRSGGRRGGRGGGGEKEAKEGKEEATRRVRILEAHDGRPDKSQGNMARRIAGARRSTHSSAHNDFFARVQRRGAIAIRRLVKEIHLFRQILADFFSQPQEVQLRKDRMQRAHEEKGSLHVNVGRLKQILVQHLDRDLGEKAKAVEG